jgi:hypothetical protein
VAEEELGVTLSDRLFSACVVAFHSFPSAMISEAGPLVDLLATGIQAISSGGSVLRNFSRSSSVIRG